MVLHIGTAASDVQELERPAPHRKGNDEIHAVVGCAAAAANAVLECRCRAGDLQRGDCLHAIVAPSTAGAADPTDDDGTGTGEYCAVERNPMVAAPCAVIKTTACAGQQNRAGAHGACIVNTDLIAAET